jgi:hypothetical protein
MLYVVFQSLRERVGRRAARQASPQTATGD